MDQSQTVLHLGQTGGIKFQAGAIIPHLPHQLLQPLEDIGRHLQQRCLGRVQPGQFLQPGHGFAHQVQCGHAFAIPLREQCVQGRGLADELFGIGQAAQFRLQGFLLTWH